MPRQKREKHSGNFVSAAMASRLCRLVGVCVFVGLMVMDVAFVLPSYLSRKQEMMASIETRVRDLVAASIDSRTDHDLFDMMQMGDNLTRSTPVKGGRIIDAIGSELAAFGSPPRMTWRMAVQMPHPVTFNSADNGFEIFLSADRTQLDHGLILRYDAAAAHGVIFIDLARQAFYGLIIAAGVAIITMLLLGRLVVYPLRSITGAIEHALHNEDTSEGRIAVDGVTGAEMTRLCDAVNDLMFFASATSDDGGGGDAAMEDIPVASVMLSEHGFVIGANAEALSLFGTKTDVDLAAMLDGGALLVEGETQTGRTLIAEGPLESTCEIRIGKKRIPCLISTTQMQRAGGGVRGYMISLVEVTDLVEDMRAETERRHDTELELRKAEQRITDLRQVFEACVILLDSTAAEPEANPVSVMPEMLITSWVGEMMRREGVGQGNVRHNSLPTLIGCTSTLRKVFRFALSSVWARSLQEVPVLFVHGAVQDGNTATFVFREIKEGDEQRTLHAGDSSEAPILIGALARVVVRSGGALLRAYGGKNSDLNEVAVQVRLNVAAGNAGGEERRSASNAA